MIGGVILFFKIMAKATKVDDEQDTANTPVTCKKCGQELSLIDTKDAMGRDVERLICQRCWGGIPSRTEVKNR